MAMFGCPSALTKEEWSCLKQSGWQKIAECPGFHKLEIERTLFTEVHCFSISTEGYKKHDCGYPWMTCEQLRRNELQEGAGKQVSSCEMVAAPYVIKYACPDGDTCARYFANEDECRALLPFMKETANNVSDCTYE